MGTETLRWLSANPGFGDSGDSETFITRQRVEDLDKQSVLLCLLRLSFPVLSRKSSICQKKRGGGGTNRTGTKLWYWCR